MNYLYYLMGKSTSGKDTIYQRLRTQFPQFKPMVLYTTRPKRANEQEGRAYYLISAEQLAAGIEKHFENQTLEQCTAEIAAWIQSVGA